MKSKTPQQTTLVGKQACRMMVASFMDENGIESTDRRMRVLDGGLHMDDWKFVTSTIWSLERAYDRDVVESMALVLTLCTSPRLADMLPLKRLPLKNNITQLIEHIWDFRIKAAVIQFETTGKWPD